ncbi:MAG: hypothetical protein D6723_15910 [Acidobacteria bacterium]|nr:MAG: hypothetical protein D6723_15910 [Acidobacteriota bacterium]
MRTTSWSLALLLGGLPAGVAIQPPGHPYLLAPPQQEQEPPPQEKPAEKNDSSDASWPRTPEMMEAEMRYRAAVEVRKSEHKRAVEAAEEILALAEKLKRLSMRSKRAPADRILQKIQKLARRIRSFGGGGKTSSGAPPPALTFRAGADKIAELAGALKRDLEGLDYRVISLSVINGANAIISLSEALRERLRSGGT